MDDILLAGERYREKPVIYCGECGAQNEEHSERCTTCNALLSLPNEDTEPVVLPDRAEAAPQTRRQVLAVFVPILLLLAAGSVWLWTTTDARRALGPIATRSTSTPMPSAIPTMLSARTPEPARSPTSVAGPDMPTATPTAPIAATATPTNALPTTATLPPIMVSPTGRIAFSSDRPVGRFPQGANRDIYSVRADGTGLVRLTGESGYDGQPAWAPTGEQLAFVSDRLGSLQVWVMNSDGSNAYQVTHDFNGASAPDWSPDGKLIAYSCGPDEKSEICLISPLGGKATAITNGPYPQTAPAWSPDGKRIVLMGLVEKHWQIFVMDADGSHLRQITHDKLDHRFPRWFPDGRIVFNTRTDQGSPDVGQIYIMNADGTNLRQITFQSDGRNGRPFPSPDGRYIAFNSDRLDNNYEIYIMRPDGSDVQRLTNTLGDDWQPAWSP